MDKKERKEPVAEEINEYVLVRQKVVTKVFNKCFFIGYLVITLYYATNVVTITETERLNGWDAAEIVFLLVFFVNDGTLIILTKYINYFLMIALFYPLFLLLCKILIKFVELGAARNLIVAMGCLRVLGLYMMFINNFMNVDDIAQLFVKDYIDPHAVEVVEGEKTNTVTPLPQEGKNKEDTQDHNHNLNAQNDNIPISNSNNLDEFNENCIGKIPLLYSGKIMLPFINNTVETDKDQLLYLEDNPPDFTKVEELTLIYGGENSLKSKYTAVLEELNHIEDINFNIFNLSKATNGQELLIFMNQLYLQYEFDTTLNIDHQVYKNYFYRVNYKYRKNPYHNSIHATDVTQTYYFLIKTCNIEKLLILDDIELFSIYYASSIHDLEHPGCNNAYEIAMNSNIALTYNDTSVLENYHLYKAFSMLSDKDCNVFKNFSKPEYNKSREQIIGMILATDMAFHAEILQKFKVKSTGNKFDPTKGEDKQSTLNMLCHSCDVSNPIKPFPIYKIWIDKVFEEFFNQGDKEREKGFSISYLCDRKTVNPFGAQIGFIDFVVMPLFTSLAVTFPNMNLISNLIPNNKEECKKIKEEQTSK